MLDELTHFRKRLPTEFTNDPCSVPKLLMTFEDMIVIGRWWWYLSRRHWWLNNIRTTDWGLLRRRRGWVRLIEGAVNRRMDHHYMTRKRALRRKIRRAVGTAVTKTEGRRFLEKQTKKLEIKVPKPKVLQEMSSLCEKRCIIDKLIRFRNDLFTSPLF